MATNRIRRVLEALCALPGANSVAAIADFARVPLDTAMEAIVTLRAAGLAMRVSEDMGPHSRFVPTPDACDLTEAAACGDLKAAVFLDQL